MDEINLYEYWEIIRRRAKLVFVCTAIAVLVAGLVLLLMPRTYRGSSTLLFSEQRGGLSALAHQLGTLGMLQGDRMFEGNLPATFAQIAQSRYIAEAVCRELQLDLTDIEAEKLAKSVEVDMPRGGGMVLSLYVPDTWAQPGRLPWLDELVRETADREPAAIMAAHITNTYIGQLQRFQEEHALTVSRRNRVFVEGELAKTQLALAQAEEDLREFREANPTVVVPEMSGRHYDQLVNLRTEQLQTEAALKETRSKRESTAEKTEDEVETIIASEVLSDNPVVTELKKQLAVLEVERASLLQDRTERHPSIVDVQDRIAAVTDHLKTEIEEITSSRTRLLNPIRQKLLENAIVLSVEETGLEARFNALDQVLSLEEQDLSKMSRPQLQLVRLVREVKALETVDTTLRGELARAKIEEAKEPQDFFILDSAIPEENHFRPRIKLTLFAALVLGLLAGMMFAFWAEGNARVRKNKKSVLPTDSVVQD